MIDSTPAVSCIQTGATRLDTAHRLEYLQYMSMDSLSRDGSTALHALSKRMEQEVEQLSVQVTEAIDSAIDEFDHTQAFTAVTLAATRSSFHAFAALLRVEERFDVHAPPEAAANARAYVRRGIPLRVLIRCYQVGHGEMWRAWQLLVRGEALEPEHEREVLARSSDVLFRYIERVTSEVIEIYEREAQQWSRSMAAIREETVKRLLEADVTDVDGAERALVYDLRAQQVGAVLWTAEASDRSAELAEAWRNCVEAGGSHSATAIHVGRCVLWGWMALHAGETDKALPPTASWEPPEGIRIAFGEAEKGVNGFRDSHRQAQEARRVLELGGSTASMVRFGDVAVPALVTADLHLAATLVRRELGLVKADAKVAGRLLITLDAYFAESESPTAAARRLGVHVNTVIYRLQQVEELLGQAPAQRRLELELALTINRYLDQRVD